LQCRDLFFHPARFKGPRTIFAPSPKQYDSLINLLMGPHPESDGRNCAIPLHPTLANRWRYDPWDSMSRFNIFRDRYERRVRNGPKPHRCVQSGVDWPELGDQHTILILQDEVRDGKPLNRAAMEAALEGLKRITQSSPLWNDWSGLQDPVICAAWTASLLN
jgi:hypothetical protein